MFDQPDVSTLRLCSMLSSTAFALVFLALWQARRGDRWLLHWAASSTLYAIVLVAFDFAGATLSPAIAAVLFALLAANTLLILSGVHVLDARPAFQPWMVALAAATGLIGAMPLVSGDPAGQIASRIALAVMLAACVGIVGVRLLAPVAGDGTTIPRRIAGAALLGYVPGYLLSILAEIGIGDGTNFLAMIPMLSDQLLLGLLNLSLLAIPGLRAHRDLRRTATRDPLTGVWNRMALDGPATRLLVPGNAAILVDIDHFKRINDRHGHATGDAVLIAVAQGLTRVVGARGGRLVRLGGDEFLALVPAGNAFAARQIAEEARRAAIAQPAGADLPGWTVSMGVALIEAADGDLAVAMARADRLLYRAKERGRDGIAA